MSRETLVSQFIKEIDNGVFVEIGTWKGDFADFILSNSKNSILYCIDPYINYSEFNDSCNDYVNDDFFNEVKNKLTKKFGERVKFIRDFSSAAVNLIPDNIDFLYIDGNHRYKYVYEELCLYYPKVKIGGVIIGDDAFDVTDDNRNEEGDIFITHPFNWGYGLYGVVKAFKDFTQMKNIKNEIIYGQCLIMK